MLARCLVVWSLVSTTTPAVAAWSLRDLRLAGPFDTVLAGAAGLVLTGCAAWAWLVTTVVVAQSVAGRSRPVTGVPGWARRAVLVACGAAVVAAAPAGAADGGGGDGGIGGLPLPDRATGGVAVAPRSAAGTARPGVTGHGHTYVVRPGDSLWAITAARLDPGAPAAEVARRTVALHRLNRAVVGPDPDVVHPGQRLRAPAALAERGEETR